MGLVNRVRNGEMEVWAGGLPQFMAAQQIQTAVAMLDYQDPSDSIPRLAFGTNLIRKERYIGEGRRSLRATITALGAVDDFRLCPDNVNPFTFLGAPSMPIVFVPGHRHCLSFLVRCSQEDNLVRVRVVLRNAAGAVVSSLADPLGNWVPVAIAIGWVDLGTGPYWVRRAVRFIAPMDDGAGVPVASAVWEIANGTAGAQILDLDDIRLDDLDFRGN